MKRKSTSTTSSASDDAPRITKAFFENGEHLIAGKRVTKAEWQQAARAQLGEVLGKKRISIMLDAAIIDHFKTTAGERGYQTLINETLRKAVAGESIVTELRTVLREELATYKVR